MKYALNDDLLVEKVVNKQLQNTDQLENIIPAGDDDKYRRYEPVQHHDLIAPNNYTLNYDTNV